MLPPRPEAVNGGLHMHSASFPQVPGLPPGMPSLAMQSEAEARGESSIGDMAPLLAAKSVSMEDLVAVELRVRSLEARHGQIHPQVRAESCRLLAPGCAGRVPCAEQALGTDTAWWLLLTRTSCLESRACRRHQGLQLRTLQGTSCHGDALEGDERTVPVCRDQASCQCSTGLAPQLMASNLLLLCAEAKCLQGAGCSTCFGSDSPGICWKLRLLPRQPAAGAARLWTALLTCPCPADGHARGRANQLKRTAALLACS